MKRNQKGFTLIELLAVIVILAIIALIATPMVLKYIDDARRGAAERSTEAVAEAAEKEYVMALLELQKNPNAEVYKTGQTYQATEFDIKNAPSAGTVTFTGDGSENVEVVLEGITFAGYPGYTCSYSGGKASCDDGSEKTDNNVDPDQNPAGE